MAITNHERVGKALDLLNAGLRPFVERELKATYKDRWTETARPSFPNWQQTGKNAKELNWDTQALLSVMWDLWNDCFRKILGPSDRSLVSELRDVRNKWAHQKTFSTDDAYRAVDSISRLLTAVAAPEVEQADQMKAEILRVKFDEQVRGQKRKESSIAVEGKPAAGLRPWREIVTPHPDVASGRYQQAEFAADLWQVFLGEGSDEYRDPVEFYRRTFITEGLQKLLSNALLRMAGQGGDPVVELQTNFGGGKTHSMLALYHLFANVPASQLPGMEAVTKIAGVSQPPKGSTGGTRRQSNFSRLIFTRNRMGLWSGRSGANWRGNSAAKKATRWFAPPTRKVSVQEIHYGCSSRSFRLASFSLTNGSRMHGSSINKSDLPAGDFDAHFTFAQTLSESAKLGREHSAGGEHSRLAKRDRRRRRPSRTGATQERSRTRRDFLASCQYGRRF